ncbi:hypothetical protein EVAR_57104_1 [Eumeta japonica]|uniref:non-specific serine/threonine protein kinase n=1 Tax=Eumeta variegata TaxID=151549 RepID=A0A4C1YII6_EUMVA|nr:hypothetical protein EVAR_57104_1 [Eumeta japonica]
MEPSKEAISVRLARLNRQVLGKASSGTRRTVDRETLFDALAVLYDECNKDSVKKNDELVRSFLDKYRSALAELRRARVCSADFEMIQIIGKGHFGDVHMVREKHSGDIYALKTLKKEAALTRRGVACYEEERDILAAGAVPWLVKLQYAFQDTANLFLVMEFCPGGDLAGFLARRNYPLPEKDAAFYVAEVAHALRALHALGYVHRDVKPHNIFLDRCGHVKLGDFGSAARLTESGSAAVPVGTPDYVAPELLSSAVSSHRHSSACDYWSLGVVAFELVTLRRPFSTDKEDSLVHTLGNIQKYEREVDPKPPFDPLPAAPSEEWRSLVTGLLTVQPSRRYHYLDTLQHPALTHLSPHNIRDQPPPWVPTLRSPADTSYFADVPRDASPTSSLIFRAKEPFSGQLPFIGFSFIFSEDNEDYSGGFSTSHDCTAIDLAAYKSAEKLAAIRGREVAALQAKLAAMEVGEQATADRLQDEAELQRSKLQREITDLIVQNKRLQRQLEVEHDERRAQERAGLELLAAAKTRHTKELTSARNKAAELEMERDSLKDNVRKLEKKVSELQAECERTAADAETAKALHTHYKTIISEAKDLQHRRLTEINVRAIDSIAKERALRRQTLSGGEQEAREAGARIATAEATAAKETRAREETERKLAHVKDEKKALERELEDLRKELTRMKELNTNRERTTDSVTEELRSVRLQLTQECSRANTLFAQVQELQNTIQEASTREANLEEQQVRTEARLQARLEEAENRAAHAQQSDAKYREKVKTLEQLVRQLEREVSALEARSLTESPAKKQDVMSDTESVGGTETSAEVGAHAQVALLKEQLERTEKQLQVRTEETAALRQEARTANLARWRKEKELTDITSEAKLSAREVKRLEERLTMVLNARKTAEQKVTELKNNLDSIRPELEGTKEELKFLKEEYSVLKKTHQTIQVEVDRSRNDIRKLKSELQYSEKRRIHAEEQAECAMRERAQLRDEAAELRTSNTQLEQNNKALQEACSVLEEQLTDLEKLSDLHELKNKDMEAELLRVRAELQSCRSELREAEREASENRTAAALARRELDEASDRAHHLQCELNVIKVMKNGTCLEIKPR